MARPPAWCREQRCERNGAQFLAGSDDADIESLCKAAARAVYSGPIRLIPLGGSIRDAEVIVTPTRSLCPALVVYSDETELGKTFLHYSQERLLADTTSPVFFERVHHHDRQDRPYDRDR
jgi:hypothetical protein